MNKSDDNWVLVYSINDDIKAEIVLQTLEEAGIKAVKMNKRDSTYLIGEVEIYVQLDDMCVAKNIVKDFDK
jgi:tmRNA-binding protein